LAGSGVVNCQIDNVSVREVGQDWTLGTGWSIGENKVVGDGTMGANVFGQNVGFTQGNTYKFSFTIEDYISGSIYIREPFNGYLEAVNSNGNYSFYYVAGASNQLDFRGNSFIGSITNISVKEVGMGWDVLNGTITDKYNASLTSYQSGIRINPFIKTGTFKVTFDLEVTSGSCKFVGGGSNEQTYSTSGAKEIIVINPSRFEFNAFNLGWVGTLDNVSVIQVTSDTNLPRINYENFSYQDALGSEEVLNGGFDDGGSNWSLGSWTVQNNTATINGQSGILSQASPPLVSGKKYKWTFEITEYNSGSVKLYSGAGSDAATYENSVGIHTQYFVANGTGKYFYSNSFNGSITNVSVKEYLGQEVVPNSGCGSWLWEPQSTNLITQSELFSDGYWAKSGSPIVTLNYGISPSGENNSVRIQGNNSTAIYHSGGFSATDGRSIYVKATSGSGNIQLLTHNGNTDNVFSIDENWQRVEINTSSSIPALFYAVDMRGSSTNIYDIEIWGAQLEVGNISSYIPTSGSQVTRNQDVCANGGSLATINSTEGTLYGEFSSIASDNNSNWINISDGTAANWLFVGRDFNKVRIYLRANNAVVFSDTTTPLANNNKVALSYKSGDIRAYVNGSEVVNLTSAFSFTSALNTLNFNAYNGGGTQTQIAWKAVAVWKEALSDSELQSLTTI